MKKNIPVFLTRTKDQFLSIQQRAARAHRLKGDFYISIHANASENPQAEGFEVWTEKDGLFAPYKKKDLFFFPKNISFVKGLDLLEKHDQITSARSLSLARSIQSKTIKIVSRKHVIKCRKNRLGLKKTHKHLFIPSVIIESGFITNKKEADLLQTEAYQNQLVEGIVSGILGFVRLNKP